ncbi:hypothetical protein RvVAR0630_18840 [Agrobacterium vitis]|nr:hypothetical protein RvVAR0630_18840 [Agrobacterium vitis]
MYCAQKANSLIELPTMSLGFIMVAPCAPFISFDMGVGCLIPSKYGMVNFAQDVSVAIDIKFDVVMPS